MSAIFPTSPAKVYIHKLPMNAEFISYDTQYSAFRLKAWIPDTGVKVKEQQQGYSSEDDRFFNNHCVNCALNRWDYYKEKYEYIADELEIEEIDLDYSDDFYERVREAVYADESACKVYFRGYRGEDCPLGNKLKELEEPKEVPLKHIVVVETVSFNKNKKKKFHPAVDYNERPFFNIHLCAGDFNNDGEIFSTKKLPAANVYGYISRDITEGIVCWGSSTRQRDYSYTNLNDLRDATYTYINSGFNNDLLKTTKFVDYIEEITEASLDEECYELCPDEKFICAGYDALMFIDGSTDIQAFYTMLLAGFKPIPEYPHIMIVPMEQASVQKDDNLYFGYLTKEDSVGRQWYISSEGFIIGQMDESFVKV